jgi:hypothetical protein
MQDLTYSLVVTLSEAKGLARGLQRCFAALSMTAVTGYVLSPNTDTSSQVGEPSNIKQHEEVEDKIKDGDDHNEVIHTLLVKNDELSGM